MRLCNRFGRTGLYFVLENISTEYYTARTASSRVSSSQGLASHEHSLKISGKQKPTAHIQRKWKHRARVGVLPGGIIWGRDKLKTNACAGMPSLAPSFHSSESKFRRRTCRYQVSGCLPGLARYKDTSIVLQRYEHTKGL